MKILSAIGLVSMMMAICGCGMMGPGPDQQTRELNEEVEAHQRSENLTRSLPPAR